MRRMNTTASMPTRRDAIDSANRVPDVGRIYQRLLEDTPTGKTSWVWRDGRYESYAGTLFIAYDENLQPYAVFEVTNVGRFVANDLWRLVVAERRVSDTPLPGVKPS